ncbi:hypothetical protein P153DRAFT_133724 [Dothidotthia symphoricarpi CBS 119687]|uniref:Uncharacterized protein n=1 Tax=Dothidotthia symphoricarpi CBS 119687 TaxID=1392245 RepID=A0A6A5ZZ21_9PLEO|nr:uncharacterized protein P153DRAFT_133724 [Dothidotthia symphoricarpi CBS 119687]KAF2124536.1 hypothetical protein P153DRAFT_133724 [Dothidotthia symphoricarpi CBS 119687]
MTTPSPQTWTLRFKSRKTTILLHVDPLHTFTTIKSHLYNALTETGLKDLDGSTIPLPSSPADIQLGRPVDVNDAQQGFQLGEWEYAASEEFDGKGKGKGKSSASKVNNCPMGANLKDNAVLALRWEGDGVWDGRDDEMDGDLENGLSGKGADMWGVQLASFDDAYGVTNESDVGGGREFEG